MSTKAKKELGKEMIWAGKWSEFYQQQRNWTMFDLWNNKYQAMMRQYHEETPKDQTHANLG